MHTLRPNDRRRFTPLPPLGKPPCRSGNSQPAKNTSPPFYVLTDRFHFLRRHGTLHSRFSHSVDKTHISVFYSVDKTRSPFNAFSASKNSSKRETPRHLCHGHSPKPHSSLSATRSLPHSPRFYTQFTPKSTPFHKFFRVRQNSLIFYTFYSYQTPPPLHSIATAIA